MRRWLVSAATVLGLSGCTQVLGIESGTESPWFCNAHVAAPSGNSSYDFHFVDDQLKPFTPPTVVLCAKNDPTCASPMPLKVTNGALSLTLDAANDGFLAVPLQPDWSAIVELGPPGNVVPAERTLPVFNKIDVLYLVTNVGVMQDDAHGALIVAAYDCNKMPAESVSIAVTVDGRPVPSTPLYFDVDFKPLMARGSTSSAGLALVSNIDPSSAASVTVERASDQAVVATAPVHVAAKTITLIYLGPTKTE